jgi:serine/threonine protein kinase
MMMETIPPGTIMHGQYRIERALGSGGFGHVYLAVDLRTQQPCALKEYLVTGPSGQAQLQHEARVLSRLHHPHLPSFIDAFSERGRYYVVLSYIEGRDLTEYLRIARQRDEAIPLRMILGWLLAICDAVQFLHSQQPPVIHRDIKPDNIRITSDSTAYLVDLGNAKAVADGARTLFFARHQGTPGYAPPEQYPGGSGTDARSDVYALGGTLYFALTMQEPASVSVRNQAAQQGLSGLPSLQEQLSRIFADERGGKAFRFNAAQPLRGTPVPRHVAQLATLSPELLQRLDAIIQRAMALQPSERYQSAAEFGRELQQVLEALQRSSSPQPASAEERRPYDPNKTQPDLPQLYEELQAARTSGQALLCPQCRAPLHAQTEGCPHCGFPLHSGNAGPSLGSRGSQGPGRHFASAGQAGPFAVPQPLPAAHLANHTPRQPQVQRPTRPGEQQQQALTSRPGPLPARRGPVSAPTPAGFSPSLPVVAGQNLRIAIAIISLVLIILLLLFLFLILMRATHGASDLEQDLLGSLLCSPAVAAAALTP